MNGGFLVTKIKQLGDRIFEKILSEKNIDTQVLFADLDILLSNRYASQPWHAKIMQNILKLSVQKNLEIGRASCRERV